MTILQNVLQKFSKVSEDVKPQPVTTFINKLQQYAPLLELQGRRQLIEVLIDDSDRSAQSIHQIEAGSMRSYQSLIMAIDTESGELVLDELFPACVHLVLGQNAIFRRCQGNHMLQFEMQLKARHENIHDGQTSLVFTLPKQLQFQPRRKQPRLIIDKSQPLTVNLQSPIFEPWFATAQNISAGGMRLTVGGNITDQLVPGSVLRQCEFKFSRDFQIRCQARVIGFRFSRTPYRHTQVSLEFINLPARQQLQLTQLIDTLTGPRVAA